MLLLEEQSERVLTTGRYRSLEDVDTKEEGEGGLGGTQVEHCNEPVRT